MYFGERGVSKLASAINSLILSDMENFEIKKKQK